MTIDANHIVMMTTDQLKDFATNVVRETIDAVRKEPKDIVTEPAKQYRYGIRAIRELFGVSHTTACRYKKTWLKPAIKERGRKIQIDVAMAQQLFQQHQNQ